MPGGSRILSLFRGQYSGTLKHQAFIFRLLRTVLSERSTKLKYLVDFPKRKFSTTSQQLFVTVSDAEHTDSVCTGRTNLVQVPAPEEPFMQKKKRLAVAYPGESWQPDRGQSIGVWGAPNPASTKNMA